MTTIMREKNLRAFLSASHSNLITDMPNTHFLVASVVVIMVRNRPGDYLHRPWVYLPTI